MSAIPLSFVIGSPLAGWILGRHWWGIGGWRWLFVLEGLPAILLGSVAFFYLTDWPRQAAWLAPGARGWIERKLEEEKPRQARSITVWQTLGSRTILLLASVAFLDYFVGYSVYFWLPTILKRQSGLSDARVGLLGAVPYIAAFAAMLINGWHSDRRRERRWHTAVPLFLAAAALLGLVTLPASTPLTVVLLTLVTLATAAFLVTFWAIPTEILSESTGAAAVGLINAVGSIAGFAGPYAFGYLLTRTGSWTSGLALMMVSALAGGVLVLGTPRAQRRAST